MNKTALSLLLAILPLFASADPVEIDGIYYNVIPKANIAEVTSHPQKYDGSVVIPETVSYLGADCIVTEIGESAFENCYNLNSVTIPCTVKRIGKNAFTNCPGLNAVYISDISVWCSIKFESNPLSYAKHFYLNDEEIRDLVIPNNVTDIADSAFYSYNGLSSITIPNSVNNIGDHAFEWCSGLTSATIGDNVTNIGESAFFDCIALSSITIGNSVKDIGSCAFSGCRQLSSVILPNSVTSIGGHAFEWCSGISQISIPNSVTSIEESAFAQCSSLTSITIPNSVSYIGVNCFYGCSGLTSIIVEDDNPVYDSRDNCNAIIVTDDNKLITACQNTIIPYGVKTIGENAFDQFTGLTFIDIPNSVENIETGAFYGCSGLTSIILPNNLTIIGECAFQNCTSLVSIDIPNRVTSIGSWAFKDCSGLRSITIPNSVANIGGSAFSECDLLKDVYCLAEKVPETAISAFEGSDIEYITLHIPEGCVEAYKTVEPWNQFKEVVPMTIKKYSLTYIVDGEEYKAYELAEGNEITPEPAPSKEGYLFSGWSTIPATMPAEDLTITGSFQLITDEDVITLKDTGKGTWCSDYDLDFTDVEGIKAYTATGYDDVDKTIWLTRVFKVPAGTGIMVKGDPGEHKIPHATVKAVYASFFKGVTGEAISINETDGDNTNYYMAGGQFKKVNGSTTISPNRAYLQLPTLVFAGTRSIDVIYEDEIDDKTGIHSAAITSDQEPGIYYNLQGQRVDNPKKGLYIKNGKKVIIK